MQMPNLHTLRQGNETHQVPPHRLFLAVSDEPF